MDSLRDDVRALLENPLPISNSQLAEVVEDTSTPNHHEPVENTFSVRSLNMFSLLTIAHDRQHFGPAIDAYARYIDGNALEELERHLLRSSIFAANSGDDLNRSPVVHTEIDLAMPDEMLIQDFRNWLKAVRSQIKAGPEIAGEGKQSKKIPEVVFRRIRDACSIEYVDLLLWSQAHDIEITA